MRGTRAIGTLAIALIPAGIPALTRPLFAAPPPDAGQMLQQLERETLPAPAPLPTPLPPAPPPLPMQALQGPTLVVKAFRFTGNTRFSNAELAAATAGHLDRPLTFTELQAAVAAAAETYRKSGWVVRAYLPEQNIADGVVTVRIVEAIFSGARLDGPPSSRIATDRVLATIDSSQPVGTPANTNQLDRALLLLGDLPGLSVQGMLRPGANERETEMIVRTQDRPLATGVVAVDNAGAQSTGLARGAGSVFFNSPLGLGDQAVVSAIGSRGNFYGRAAWSLPVGYDGWRMGVSGSYLKYNLISAAFRPLDARGASTTQGLSAAWPALRSRTANLYLALNYDHRHFDNQALGAAVSAYGVHAFSAGLNGSLFDEWLGSKAVNTIGVTGAWGVVGSGHPAFTDAASDERFRYAKLRWSVSREQQVTDEISFFAAASGQFASRTLDSSERFYLGGPEGVRAYAVDKAGGSRGQMANLEIRWKLPESIVLTAFYDWGHLDYSHGLSSAGLTASWQADFGLILRTTWANSIGKDPDNADDGDPNNARPRTRFWLSATQPF